MERPDDKHFTHHHRGENSFENWIEFLDYYGYASPEVVAWLRAMAEASPKS